MGILVIQALITNFTCYSISLIISILIGKVPPMLEGKDDFKLKKLKDLLDNWPIAIHLKDINQVNTVQIIKIKNKKGNISKYIFKFLKIVQKQS